MGWLLGFSEVIYNDEFCPDVIKSAINDHSEHSEQYLDFFFYPFFMLHIIICFI